MDALPGEILPVVAEYLPPPDAISLDRTCRSLHRGLSLTAVAPRRILAEFLADADDDAPRYGFPVPVPREVPCHSCLLSMTWRAAARGGGGECRVLVVEGGYPRRGRASGRFGGGRVVYRSAAAPLWRQRLDVTLRPEEGREYHLWYVGGGGEGIVLGSVSVRALVFDDPSRCFGRSWNLLTRTEALPAWDRGSGSAPGRARVERFLTTGGERLPPPLVALAQKGPNGVADADPRRKLVGFLESLWKSWNAEIAAYEKIAAGRPSPRDDLRRFENMQVDDFLEDRMDFGEFIAGGLEY